MLKKIIKIISLKRKKYAQDLLAKAIRLERSKKIQEALSIVRTISILKIKNPKILDSVGRFFYRNNYITEAIKNFENALKYDKDAIVSTRTLAHCYSKKDYTIKKQRLLVDMESKQKLNPSDRIFLAEHLLKNTKNKHLALAHYNKAFDESKDKLKLQESYANFLVNFAVADARSKDNFKRTFSCLNLALSITNNKEKFEKQILKINSCLQVSSNKKNSILSKGTLKQNNLIIDDLPINYQNYNDQALKFEAIKASKDKSRHLDAERILNYIVNNSPKDDKMISVYANTLTKTALLFDADGNEQQAYARFKKAISLLPHNVANNMLYANFLIKKSNIKECKKILDTISNDAGELSSYHLMKSTVLLKLHKFEEARLSAKKVLNDPNGKFLDAYTKLADISAAEEKFDEAIFWTEKLLKSNSNKSESIRRRVILYKLRKGQLDLNQKKKLKISSDFFLRNTPKLNFEQKRILDEIINKGICITDFDNLFGSKEKELWDEADAHVRSFTDNSSVLELAKRITECENFNLDSEFASSFKPSLISYRTFKKNKIYASEKAFQIYLNKKILDIANSYHEMMSKIRNVALWYNPPITKNNIGIKKGSQLWHRDQEDENILKCFIYYSDVYEGSGPTEYIKYSKVKPIGKYSKILPYPSSSGYPGEHIVESTVDSKDIVKALGPRKSIVFLDTNGFHRGGYVTKNRRILTMATFLRPITPYCEQNTKLLLDGFDSSKFSHEANYGLLD